MLMPNVASKNHNHAAKNPYSQFRTPWTPEQVLASPAITDYLTKLMCCPTSDGGMYKSMVRIKLGH